MFLIEIYNTIYLREGKISYEFSFQHLKLISLLINLTMSKIRCKNSNCFKQTTAITAYFAKRTIKFG
jgi:hypothetical protein